VSQEGAQGAGGRADVTMERQGDHVAVVCMRRPPDNYFDTALVEAVASAYEELAGTDWCRALVLASEGKHFCAGLDFAGNAGQEIGALYEEALRLFAAPLPVVAAVQGAAIGGGCGLALSADFRVASPRSRFSANFSQLGFHHGFALTVTLPAAVGAQAAADLLLTGRRVGGEEALSLGLCERLVDDGQELAGALGYARELAAAGPLAVRAIRATLRRGLVDAVRQALAQEQAEQVRLRDTNDFAEGVRAMAERRAPRFTAT
jgi:2-(1,2-epoxy-1,2-dihydrophenyl)acetyl-CoA isomerase